MATSGGGLAHVPNDISTFLLFQISFGGPNACPLLHASISPTGVTSADPSVGRASSPYLFHRGYTHPISCSINGIMEGLE